MSNIDAATVKQLRDLTNAGFMDCKKALVEADGDMEAAKKILREKGIGGADKKADRTAADGAIGVYISPCGTKAALLELNCETDFVARNETFRKLANDLAQQVVEGNPADNAAFLAQSMGGSTVEETVRENIATIGENIVPARFVRFEGEGTVIGSYLHSDGKQAALVEVQGSGDAAQEVARNVAMQAVALKAPYLGREDVPADVIESEKEIYRNQAAGEGKPEEMLAKIAEGRINKFYGENTLLEQKYVKDESGKQSVAQMVKAAGGDLKVNRFARLKVGES